MTLREKLNEMQPTDFVSIGSGTAYFFIGEVREFQTVVKQEGEALRQRQEASVRYTRNRAKKALKAVRQCDCEQTRKTLEIKRKDYREALNNYVHYESVLDREVLETYGRICDPGIAIIIEGNDSGTLWLYSERVDRRASKSVR